MYKLLISLYNRLMLQISFSCSLMISIKSLQIQFLTNILFFHIPSNSNSFILDKSTTNHIWSKNLTISLQFVHLGQSYHFEVTVSLIPCVLLTNYFWTKILTISLQFVHLGQITTNYIWSKTLTISRFLYIQNWLKILGSSRYHRYRKHTMSKRRCLHLFLVFRMFSAVGIRYRVLPNERFRFQNRIVILSLNVKTWIRFLLLQFRTLREIFHSILSS